MESLQSCIRYTIPVIKILVVAVSLLFLGFSLWQSITPEIFSRLREPSMALLFILVSVCYGGLLVIPAIGWALLIRLPKVTSEVKFRYLIGIYGTTLVAKYLPGNVFHLIGRQVAAASRGIEHASTAVASLYEVMLVISAGAGISVVTMFLTSDDTFFVVPSLPAATTQAAIVGGFVLPWLAISMGRLGFFTIFNRLIHGLGDNIDLPWERVMLSWLFYTTFILGVSCLLWVIASGFTTSTVPFLPILTLYGLIYVLSYVMPGAPGGLGVREALTVLVLGPYLGAAVAGFSAVFLRLTMMSGEAIFCGLSIAITRSGRT